MQAVFYLLDANGFPEANAARFGVGHFARIIDNKKRKIVYTDFKDEVLGVRDEEVVAVPKMTGVQYEKKVKDYLGACPRID